MELLSLFLLLSMMTLSSTLFEGDSGVKSVVDDRVVTNQIMQPSAREEKSEESSKQGETKAESPTNPNEGDATNQDDADESETPPDDDEDTQDTEDDEDDEEEEGIDGIEDLDHVLPLEEMIIAEGKLDRSNDKQKQLEPAKKTQPRKGPLGSKTHFQPKQPSKILNLHLAETKQSKGTLAEYEGDLEALNDILKAFHLTVKELPTKPAEKPETSKLNNQLNPHVPTVLGNQPTLTGTAWFFCPEYMRYLTAIVSNATRSRHKEHEVYGRLVVTDKRYPKSFSWVSATDLAIRTPEIITAYTACSDWSHFMPDAWGSSNPPGMMAYVGGLANLTTDLFIERECTVFYPIKSGQTSRPACYLRVPSYYAAHAAAA